MRNVSAAVTLRLAAAAAFLWCAGLAAAEPEVKQTMDQSVPRGSRLDQVKAVTAEFDTDTDALYRKELREQFAAQDRRMEKAIKLLDERKFAESVKVAEEVRNELKLKADSVNSEVIRARLAEAEALVARLRLAWGRERLQAANTALNEHRIPDAIAISSEAAQISPALRRDAEVLRQRGFDIQKHEKFQAATALSEAAPHLSNLRREAKSLLAEAQVFYDNKRYPEAINRIEQVYLRDPFNLEAVALAGKIYKRYFSVGYHRHRADFELLTAYANWQWTEPVFEAPVKKELTTTEVKDTSFQATNNKLNRIIFPRFEFDRADVSAVIEFLQKRNKDFDPEKEGVVIHEISVADDLEKLGKVTLRLSDIPMREVLRYISLMTGLKYRVERDGVSIGTNLDTMYERTYEIRPHLRSWVASLTTAGSGGGGGGNANPVASRYKKDDGGAETLEKGKTADKELKLADAADITETKVTNEMFREYLEQHGIRFPQGSSVSYLDVSNELVVKNSLQNLNAISSLIREQNAQESELIMIEVKSIEISDTDMEELGFDWSLGETNLNHNMANDGTRIDTSKTGWMFGPGPDTRTDPSSGKRGSMNPIRTGFTDGTQSTALINKLNIFPLIFGSKTPFGSDVAIDISLTVNALSQNTRTEMISAPKIIALADYPAQARLTKSYWFPDSWSDLKVETNTSDSQTTFEITRPVPEFEEQELGIFLNVTPSITETGTISLNLDMKVLGRNGNDEYSFSLTGTVNGRSYSSNFTIWKPVITTRQIKTNIDVYDGQTVVVGGATDNRTNVRSDKIPFLGELPFIGRLFQAQSQKAERRNMLIFVTARLLGTDGAPVNGLGKNGAPDFNR